MRLTEAQKAAALARRPGAILTRFGDVWGAVWFEADQPTGQRWRGQLLAFFDTDPETGASRPWWTSEVGGARRRDVVEQLTAEVV